MTERRTYGAEFKSSSAVGAASELIAAAELMARGYYVYRCESPHAPFDLVAYRNGELIRVEVKTISQPKSGLGPAFSWPANDEWDLLVLVGPRGCMFFGPDRDRDGVRGDVREAYGFRRSSRPPEHPCGTPGAYERHRYRREEPCEPCRVASQAYTRARHQATKRVEGSLG